MSAKLNWPQFGPDLNDNQLKEILGQIENTGFYTCNDFLVEESVQHWKHFADNLSAEDLFRDSKIGKRESAQQNASIRSDKIFWIQDFDASTQPIADWLGKLATELKNYFRIPIEDFESHFSIYPPGAHYSKHIDNPNGLSPRLFTFIFYLNPIWQPGHGGELVIYNPEQPDIEILRVSPKGGTFVLFRSDRFHHEVKEAFEPRYTFTGWMRRNARV